MEKPHITLIISLLFVFMFSASAVYTINVAHYGAKSDGRTDSTQAFLKAWISACSSRQPVLIYVSPGRFLIRQVHFSGPCRNNDIHFTIRGTLVAPRYQILNTANWILFSKVNGVSIVGGTLDGRGSSFWACRATRKRCPRGAKNLAFYDSTNIRIRSLTSVNSQLSHIAINSCNNVLMQDLNVDSPADSPNTDGIQIQYSTGVTILGTNIKTGDDCVSIGPGTRNVWIEGSNCGPGHGISIGSLGKAKVEQGVKNVTVKNVVFTESDNGLRIKTWARPSNGFVEDVLYQDIIMKNVKNPVIIDQHYCPRRHGCSGHESGIRISQVTYRNIRGTSATQVGMSFDCSRTNPCKKIKLQTVKLTYRNRVARSTCHNADTVSTGSVLAESCL